MSESLVKHINRKKRNIVRQQYETLKKKYVAGGPNLTMAELVRLQIEFSATFEYIEEISRDDTDDYMIELSRDYHMTVGLMYRRINHYNANPEMQPGYVAAPPPVVDVPSPTVSAPVAQVVPITPPKVEAEPTIQNESSSYSSSEEESEDEPMPAASPAVPNRLRVTFEPPSAAAEAEPAVEPSPPMALHPSQSDEEQVRDEVSANVSDSESANAKVEMVFQNLPRITAGRAGSIRGRHIRAMTARDAALQPEPALVQNNFQIVHHYGPSTSAGRSASVSPRGRSRSDLRDNPADLLQENNGTSPSQPSVLPVMPPKALAKHNPDNPACFGPPKAPVYCLACTMYKEKSQHRLWECERFLLLTVEERRTCCDNWDLCRVCTKIGHMVCDGLLCGHGCVSRHNPIFCAKDPTADVEYNKIRFQRIRDEKARASGTAQQPKPRRRRGGRGGQGSS